MQRLSALLLLSLVVACSEPQQDAGTGTVTVYSGLADTERVQALAQAFTAATGVKVTLKHGEPELVVDAVIANNGAPTADVLLTPGVGGAWRAAEEGGLRALRSEALLAVPAAARDPDGFWFGFSTDVAAIAYNVEKIPTVSAYSYQDLADPGLQGKLCLSSSALTVNRNLVAMLIATMETRPAERLVQGWLNNLAVSPYPDEEKLLDALHAGTCSIGIVSESAFAKTSGTTGASVLKISRPTGGFFDIEAAGVARHASHPHNAQRFVEWLVATKGPTAASMAGLSTRNAGLAGWHAEDAVKLAERRSYY